LPSAEKTQAETAAPGSNVLVTSPVPTSIKRTACSSNVAATCLPSGVNVNQSVTAREPPPGI
jgi:hypothetical protein